MNLVFIVKNRDETPFMVVRTTPNGSTFEPMSDSAKDLAKMLRQEYGKTPITKPELVQTMDASKIIEGPSPSGTATQKKVANISVVGKELQTLPVLSISEVLLSEFSNEEFKNVLTFKASSFISDQTRSSAHFEIKGVRAIWDPSLSIPGTNRRGGFRCPVGTRYGGQITDRFGRSCGWGVARRIANQIADIGERLEQRDDDKRKRRLDRRNARMIRRLGGVAEAGRVEGGLMGIAQRLDGGSDATPKPRNRPNRDEARDFAQRVFNESTVGRIINDVRRRPQNVEEPEAQAPSTRAPRNRRRDVIPETAPTPTPKPARRPAPAGRPQARPQPRPRVAPQAGNVDVLTARDASDAGETEAFKPYVLRKYNEYAQRVRKIREGGGNAGMLTRREWYAINKENLRDAWKDAHGRSAPQDFEPPTPQARRPRNNRGRRRKATAEGAGRLTTRRPTPDDVPEPAPAKPVRPVRKRPAKPQTPARRATLIDDPENLRNVAKNLNRLGARLTTDEIADMQNQWDEEQGAIDDINVGMRRRVINGDFGDAVDLEERIAINKQEIEANQNAIDQLSNQLTRETDLRSPDGEANQIRREEVLKRLVINLQERRRRQAENKLWQEVIDDNLLDSQDLPSPGTTEARYISNSVDGTSESPTPPAPPQAPAPALAPASVRKGEEKVINALNRAKDRHEKRLPKLANGKFDEVPVGNKNIRTKAQALAYTGSLSDIPDKFLEDVLKKRSDLLNDRNGDPIYSGALNKAMGHGDNPTPEERRALQLLIKRIKESRTKPGQLSNEDKEILKKVKELGVDYLSFHAGTGGANPTFHLLIGDNGSVDGRGYLLKPKDRSFGNGANHSEFLGAAIAEQMGFAHGQGRIIPGPQIKGLFELGPNFAEGQVKNVGAIPQGADAVKDKESRLAAALLNGIMGAHDRHGGNGMVFDGNGALPIDFGRGFFDDTSTAAKFFRYIRGGEYGGVDRNPLDKYQKEYQRLIRSGKTPQEASAEMRIEVKQTLNAWRNNIQTILDNGLVDNLNARFANHQDVGFARQGIPQRKATIQTRIDIMASDEFIDLLMGGIAA